MKLLTALALLGVLCLQLSASPVYAQKCRTMKECRRKMYQFYDARKTIKLNVTQGSVIAEPDDKKLTVTKSSKFIFIGFLKLKVDGAGVIQKSFPNGEFGGKVTFAGTGTIEYSDSGQVVFVASTGKQLKVTAEKVSEVVFLDNTVGTVTDCHYVNAYRNSVVSATECNTVSAYTDAQVTVQRCIKATAYDNAKLTEVKTP